VPIGECLNERVHCTLRQVRQSQSVSTVGSPQGNSDQTYVKIPSVHPHCVISDVPIDFLIEVLLVRLPIQLALSLALDQQFHLGTR
jgi:hypothetical protein